MKILFLVEDIAKISGLLRQDANLKVIDEFEISQDTPYIGGMVQPGYSEYITNRTATFSKVYKAQKTLCMVLDQRHHKPLDKIPHDVSIRVCKQLIPNKLRNSFLYSVDKIYLEDEFTLDGLVA